MSLWRLATSETAGYKRADPAALLARRALLRGLTMTGRAGKSSDGGGCGLDLVLDDAHPPRGDDVLDALIATLVAAAACTPGGVEGPPAPDSPHAALEGWIAVPIVPLGQIAPVP